MTTTLIVLLVITLLAIIFLPFSRALMKDREELYENPLEQKFKILISRVNELLMSGHGEVVKFKDDPRMLNLFDENCANLLINFYYSTGTLTITLYYKYFNVELVKRMQFHNLRQAETFHQQDVANHFCEESARAMRQHRAKVNGKNGLNNVVKELFCPDQNVKFDSENPVDLVRSIYSGFSREQKLALVNVARIIYTANGSSEESFRNHPQFSGMLQNLQVNYSEVQSQAKAKGELDIINLLRDPGDNKFILIIMGVFPFVMDLSGVNEARADKFYSVFERLGYSQEIVDKGIEKTILLMQQFGIE